MNTAQYIFNKLHLVARLIIIIISIILVYGFLMHLIEPATFPNLADGIWFTIESITTVGYGEIVPITLEGRFAASTLILIGAAFVSYYYASMSSYVIKRQTALQLGSAIYTKKKHLIIVGWNECAKILIKNWSMRNPHQNIVIIDETLESHPMPDTHIFFLKSDSTNEQTWKNANISESEMIIITADHSKSERNSDLHVIASLLCIKGIHADATCICEILTPFQMKNAERAGADHIIATNSIIGHSIIEAAEKMPTSE